MQKGKNSFKYMLLISLFIHLLIVAIFSLIYIKKIAGKDVYLTEVTLIGEMPYGKGLGQKGEVTEKSGLKTVKETQKAKEAPVKIADEKPVKKIKIVASTEDDIVKIRKELPIGMADTEPREHEGVAETPIIGGGFGEDNEKPGSLTGNLDITGPIASRGIKYRADPKYPDWARKQGVEGVVTVQIKVDSKGDVKDIFVVKTCGFKVLDQVVIDCMRSWKFDVLPISANQIDQEGKITFKFNLKK